MSAKKSVKKKSTTSKKVVKKIIKKAPTKNKTIKNKVAKKPIKKKSIKKPSNEVKIKNPDIHIIGHNIRSPHDIHKDNIKKQSKNKKKQEKIEIFDPILNRKKGIIGWLKTYIPVLITLGIGILTYLYLIFYMFYPTSITQGNYIQFLVIILFIFLIAGILIMLGLKSELMFVRIISFIFVFIIFTFILLFILVAHALQGMGL